MSKRSFLCFSLLTTHLACTEVLYENSIEDSSESYPFYYDSSDSYPGSCVNCAQLWPSRGPDWIITPNAGPCVCNGADAFVIGQFLYWTAYCDHLGYAITTGHTTNNPTPSSSLGRVYYPDWKFAPGFKAGLGMLFDHDGWDLYANYTWLRFHDVTSSVHAQSASKLISDFLWGLNGSFNGNATTQMFNQSARGKWQLDFNAIDLELGRNFFVSRYLQLRPHFGFKTTWQCQEMDVLFEGIGQNMTTNIAFPFTTTSCNKIENWGIGLRTGLDAAWHFTKSFSLVGEASITALWEHFEVLRKDVEKRNVSLFNSNLHYKNTFNTIVPLLELYLALRWESWYFCDSYHISLEAGWEEQWWAKQNQFNQIAAESRAGDLILHGFVLQIRFDL